MQHSSACLEQDSYALWTKLENCAGQEHEKKSLPRERRSSLDPQTVNDILFVRSIQNILEQKQNFFS